MAALMLLVQFLVFLIVLDRKIYAPLVVNVEHDEDVSIKSGSTEGELKVTEKETKHTKIGELDSDGDLTVAHITESVHVYTIQNFDPFSEAETQLLGLCMHTKCLHETFPNVAVHAIHGLIQKLKKDHGANFKMGGRQTIRIVFNMDEENAQFQYADGKTIGALEMTPEFMETFEATIDEFGLPDLDLSPKGISATALFKKKVTAKKLGYYRRKSMRRLLELLRIVKTLHTHILAPDAVSKAQKSYLVTACKKAEMVLENHANKDRHASLMELVSTMRVGNMDEASSKRMEELFQELHVHLWHVAGRLKDVGHLKVEGRKTHDHLHEEVEEAKRLTQVVHAALQPLEAVDPREG